MEKVELEEFLRANGVDFSTWGLTSTSRFIENLLEEIAEQESVLEATSEGIIRYCSIVYIHITHLGKYLKEDRTEWKDGRLPRFRNLAGSMSEKMKAGETELEAAVRGVKEELGLRIESERFTFLQQSISCKPSVAYPGLITKANRNGFALELNAREYASGGYIENTLEKITYFLWT